MVSSECLVYAGGKLFNENTIESSLLNESPSSTSLMSSSSSANGSKLPAEEDIFIFNAVISKHCYNNYIINTLL